jgi:hypothetical protein
MRVGGLCLVATACVSTKVQILDQSVRPVRTPDAVSALQEAPQQPYTVIAGPQKTDERFIFNGTVLIKSERKRLSGKVIVFEGATQLQISDGQVSPER